MNFIARINKNMENIKYGWLDKSGECHEDMDGFGEKYMLQLPKQLQDSKLGVCWDQVELERKLFKDANIDIQTFFIVHYDGAKCPTHTFAIFQHGEKTYWYEHSWLPMRGLHEYPTINEALADIRTKFINNELRNKYDPSNLRIHKYDAPRQNLSCPEFYAHCEKGRVVKI